MQAGELERRSRQLEVLGDAAFLRELGAWLAFADRDPSSAIVLAELRGEYLRLLDRRQRDHEDALLGLLDLREQLAALVGIELIAQPLPPATGEGASRVYVLIEVVRRELREFRPAAATNGDWDPFVRLTRRFEVLAMHHARRDRDYIALLHSSPNGSLRRLEWLANEVAPDPLSDYTAEDFTGGSDSALTTALASVRPLLQAALSEQPDLTPSEQRQLGHIVDAARADAARVQERVRRRAHVDAVARHHYVRTGLGVAMNRARGRCA